MGVSTSQQGNDTNFWGRLTLSEVPQNVLLKVYNVIQSRKEILKK